MKKTTLVFSLIGLAPVAGLQAVTVYTPTLSGYVAGSASQGTDANAHEVNTLASNMYGWVDWSGATSGGPVVDASGGATITFSGLAGTDYTTSAQRAWTDNRMGTRWVTATNPSGTGTVDYDSWGLASSGFLAAGNGLTFSFDVSTAGSYTLYLDIRANTPSNLTMKYLQDGAMISGGSFGSSDFGFTGGTVSEAFVGFKFDVSDSDLIGGSTTLAINLGTTTNTVIGLGGAYVTATPIPEPSTYAFAGLAGLGAIALGLRRRRAK